jgi:hypothetical protein
MSPRFRLQPGFVNREGVAIAQNHGPLYHILQLANITGPIVSLSLVRNAIGTVMGSTEISFSNSSRKCSRVIRRFAEFACSIP